MRYDFIGRTEDYFTITTEDMKGKDPYGDAEAKNIKPIKMLSDDEYTGLISRIIANNSDRSLKRALDVEFETERSIYDPWLSVYYSNKRGEGILLIRELREGVYENAFLCAYGANDEESIKMMLFASLKLMKKSAMDDSVFYVGEAGEVISDTMHMICPDYIPQTMERGVRTIKKRNRGNKRDL